MILGIGSDLASITRIEGVLNRHGERFISRIFTQAEQDKVESRPFVRAAGYAKRWAAKEACAKALGTGIDMGIGWRDMAVDNVPGGRPVMVLGGKALERLHAITPQGHHPIVHVTLTDDHPWAQAFVVIEARPVA